VDSPSPLTLSPAGSISYPVKVQSLNGQSGTVNLSVSGTPAGVGVQFNPAQVVLSAGGPVSSTITFTGSANIPGGTYPLVLTGTLGSIQRTAAISLNAQVTTFQVSSATGSGIVHNTGQEIQTTHNVPAGNAPTYTTCSSLDPDVTCRVMGSSTGTVTLGVTAAAGAVHGTRALKLNGGQTTVHLAVANFWGSSLPTIRVQAGQSGSAPIPIPDDCYFDGPCGFATVTPTAPWWI
jgi:hypothetical protein